MRTQFNRAAGSRIAVVATIAMLAAGCHTAPKLAAVPRPASSASPSRAVAAEVVRRNAITSLTVRPAYATLIVGAEMNFSTAVAQPPRATLPTVVFASDDSTIARVDPSTGVVLGVAPGKTSIRVTASAPETSELAATTLLQLLPVTVTAK
jgi:uncharacterized protein YjdB